MNTASLRPSHLPGGGLMGLLLTLVLVAGCGITGHKQERLLHDTLDRYAEVARWGQPAALLAFQQSAAETKTPESNPVWQTIDVTHYETVAPVRELSEGRVSQTASIEYISPDQRVRRILDRQIWVYDQQDKRWYRENALPKLP